MGQKEGTEKKRKNEDIHVDPQICFKKEERVPEVKEHPGIRAMEFAEKVQQEDGRSDFEQKIEDAKREGSPGFHEGRNGEKNLCDRRIDGSNRRIVDADQDGVTRLDETL